MAILITVFACDECHSTVGLKTDEDWKKFEATWWEGFKMQFCPKCAEMPETQARRLADSRDLPEFVKPLLTKFLCR